MSNITIPKLQRALVLQGGGALGAYEVGVIRVLYDELTEIDKKNREEGRLLFDIIAGTSIGAMNGAVLVSNVVNRNKTWKDAVKELENFWTEEKKGLSSTPDFGKWWRNNGDIPNAVSASDDAARKYYSVKEYFRHGTPKVCTAPVVRGLDAKFGDQTDNLWFLHDSKPLEDTIVHYSKDQNNKKLKIATSWNKGQPRLLVFSVEVAEGKIVTFDSYYRRAEDSENSLYEDDGINIDHVMASGTLPEFYDFRKIGGLQFCDGGLLSNTPFRELLQAHQHYWQEILGKDRRKIPNLEVYIVNVHPSKGDPVAEGDHDAVKDRINDITFSDRNSEYDENVTNMATDYIELIDRLKDLAESYINKDEINAFRNDFENFLETAETKSKSHAAKYRKYSDLLKGQFKLIKVVRIEPERYTDSISGKGVDFTSKTIKDLIEKGKKDALKVLK